MLPSPDRLPLEIHLLIFKELEHPSDMRAWISASRTVFANFLVYWPTVFAIHMELNLLPEALAVVRLRRIHRESKAPVEAERLVDLVCGWLGNLGPVSPRSLLPGDFTTVVALLELIEDTNSIVSNLLGRFWNPQRIYLTSQLLPRPDPFTDDPFMPMPMKDELYYQQQGVLSFELCVLALFHAQKPAERALIGKGETHDRLASVIGSPTWGDGNTMFSHKFHFVWVASAVCSQNDDYLRLASRKAVGTRSISGRPCPTSNMTLHGRALSLCEALM
ncbi:hypothetical protein LX36DRAFT_192671 [Colletotrichum falcatum]|nr:hypothetical protein LX36DRAFT_192671 [Colletotrichum falcatum]